MSATPDTTLLCRKLANALPLRQAEIDLIGRLPDAVRVVPAGTALVTEGEEIATGYLIQAGWAYRARFMQDGGRQIVNFLVPGDLTEAGVFVTGVADHSVIALTDVTVATYPHEKWFDLLPTSARLTTALWWYASHEEAVLKEHIVSLGRRDPINRLYYLIWELWRRLALVGLAEGGGFDLPVGREALADVLGLSLRHLSRALTKAQEDGILDIGRRHITIHDEAALLREVDCQDMYLQIASVSRKLHRAFERAEET